MPEAMAREEYDRMAGFYDQLWRVYVTNTLSLLAAWARIGPPATVLDVACGTGAFEGLLLCACPCQRIVGIDISAHMLAIAARKCAAATNVVFQQARASALPCVDGSFDVVVSANAFHYFDEPLTVLAEMKRVLKPGGRTIILDWCKDFRLCALCDIMLSAIDPAHKHCYTQEELHRLLAAAGFTVQRAARVRLGAVWGLMIATAVFENASSSAVSSAAPRRSDSVILP
jgi:ubiquinone/menaquinone biosynthesis C-methylase UbiE